MQPAGERVDKRASGAVASDLVHHDDNCGHPLRKGPPLGHAPRMIGAIPEELAQSLDGRPDASWISKPLHGRRKRKSLDFAIGLKGTTCRASKCVEHAWHGGSTEHVLPLGPGLLPHTVRGVVLIDITGDIR